MLSRGTEARSRFFRLAGSRLEHSVLECWREGRGVIDRSIYLLEGHISVVPTPLMPIVGSFSAYFEIYSRPYRTSASTSLRPKKITFDEERARRSKYIKENIFRMLVNFSDCSIRSRSPWEGEGRKKKIRTRNTRNEKFKGNAGEFNQFCQKFAFFIIFQKDVFVF